MKRWLAAWLCVSWLVVALPASSAHAPPKATADGKVSVKRTEDVVYGRKFGVALTLDVFQPEKPNGAGVILCISGGWVSNHDVINTLFRPFHEGLTSRGYTVFAVCHACQPKFAVPEILQDMHRAVRFVRHNAKKYGVDPNRMGITGMSAGGHLSLMMGTIGAKGKPNAFDPVERESSEVQCVASFVPPTDFLNYGKPGESAVGVGKLKAFRPAFGLTTDDPAESEKRGREISPYYHLSANTAPTLIIHGEVDPLVPVEQAQKFVKRCEELKVPAKIVVKKGYGHGWDMRPDIITVADWFDQHLGVAKKS